MSHCQSHWDEDLPLPDYFVDMINQLAQQARDVGEPEVAILLEATARARQKSLDEPTSIEDDLAR